MKKIILFVLALCLCFTVFGGATFAEAAPAEAPAAEWYRKALDAGYEPYNEEEQARLKDVLGDDYTAK